MGHSAQDPIIQNHQEAKHELGHILIVDDNEDIVQLLSETIKEHTNFKCVTATTPAKALELFASYRIDIVILDMVMPKMNGIEVFQILRNRSINVPVIFLTGQGDNDLRRQALTLGAFDFLSKPIKARDLLILVEEAYKTTLKIRKILSKAAS